MLAAALLLISWEFWGLDLPADVSVRECSLKAACLCDARERDLEPLPVTGQSVRLTIPGAIASVRLLT
jgi:hypothetical protein